MTPDTLRRFAAFVSERHAIYLRRQVLADNGPGFPLQYGSDPHLEAWEAGGKNSGTWEDGYLTADPVLQRYRFCNVYRELDRVTVWVRENIRQPYADHPNLWMMLAMARTINWPPTLQMLMDLAKDDGAEWPLDERYDPEAVGRAMDHAKQTGNKVYTGAYMIRAESNPDKPWCSWTKQRYIACVVLGLPWAEMGGWVRLLEATVPPARSLQSAWERIQSYTGWGPFMAYQWVVDMRWTRYLDEARDIGSWAALGPGSRRGLNRLYGRPVGTVLRQPDGLTEMLELRAALCCPGVLASWVPLPELSDVQNCLCEWDKYERARLGEGRPRALYVPGRGS